MAALGPAFNEYGQMEELDFRETMLERGAKERRVEASFQSGLWPDIQYSTELWADGSPRL